MLTSGSSFSSSLLLAELPSSSDPWSEASELEGISSISSDSSLLALTRLWRPKSIAFRFVPDILSLFNMCMRNFHTMTALEDPSSRLIFLPALVQAVSHESTTRPSVFCCIASLMVQCKPISLYVSIYPRLQAPAGQTTCFFP
jgi:hypothetical protein